jgi:osmotically-inducible protein OsmY
MNAGLSIGEVDRIYADDDADDSPLILEIERALRATGYMPLRNLRVLRQGRLVILQGQVATYHMKQLAQATAQSVAGVGRVENEVDVRCG